MIPATLEALVRPLEEFEAIRRRAVRLGDRLCDLSYANPYEGVVTSVREVLRRALDRERLLDLQYTPFGGQTLTRRAVADDLTARQGLEFTYRDVVLTPGAMAALHLALRATGEPGDEVVIPVPCWLDYPLYAAALGLRPVLVPLGAPEFQLDVGAVERALGPRTAAVLVSNPSNPAGRSYPAPVFRALGEALERAERGSGRRITLIADETHRDFTLAGVHVPAATLIPRTLTVYSFGKYHFIQGQRIGYVAVSPGHPEREALATELARWARILGVCTPTALMQAAVPELLALHHDLGPVEHWRRALTDALRGAGYTVTPADATLFVYVATPGGMPDVEFVRRLAEAGTLALPASVFHHQGHFRLALTGGARMLEGGIRALQRLAAA
ncbi:MAG TPA: aminotransferase class I/II-fold pyridoxal phosphate-dependent enzyme [Gemmatimonadales bacterium]